MFTGKYTLAAALMFAGCLGASASAQQNMRFAELDTNRDGVITRNEWRGNDQSFRMQDWDGDGVLSGDEVRPNGRRSDSSQGYQFDDWTAERFRRLDPNNDGRILRSEWPFERNTFDRADSNGDGILTRQEFLNASAVAGGFTDWTTARFSTMDSNRDNRITRAEWRFDRISFDRADDNGDGMLTRQEFLNAAGVAGTSGFNDWTAAAFNNMDRDRDNRITRYEWRFDRASFDRADYDNDDIVTRREFMSVSPGVGGTGTAGFEDWTDARFNTLDRDRDNRITRAEWRFDRASFDRADDNNDGIVTRREFMSVAPIVGTSGRGEVEFDDWTEARFNQLDRNRDNRITSNEWLFDRDSYARADYNRDGTLTRSEFLGLEGIQVSDPVVYTSGERFDRLDRNNDGWIARGEWAGTRAAFDALDLNHDGTLNRDEFSRNASAPAPQQNGSYQLGYERGVTEGRAAGLEDRQRNQGWDLEGQRELEAADSGYEPRFGSRTDYQNGYRVGFRLGYPEGWNSAR